MLGAQPCECTENHGIVDFRIISFISILKKPGVAAETTAVFSRKRHAVLRGGRSILHPTGDERGPSFSTASPTLGISCFSNRPFVKAILMGVKPDIYGRNWRLGSFKL